MKGLGYNWRQVSIVFNDGSIVQTEVLLVNDIGLLTQKKGAKITTFVPWSSIVIVNIEEIA